MLTCDGVWSTAITWSHVWAWWQSSWYKTLQTKTIELYRELYFYQEPIIWCKKREKELLLLTNCDCQLSVGDFLWHCEDSLETSQPQPSPENPFEWLSEKVTMNSLWKRWFRIIISHSRDNDISSLKTKMSEEREERVYSREDGICWRLFDI